MLKVVERLGQRFRRLNVGRNLMGLFVDEVRFEDAFLVEFPESEEKAMAA